ncbi:hypothetical protein ACWDYK_39095, partial [Streptomyces anthocyanicus]
MTTAARGTASGQTGRSWGWDVDALSVFVALLSVVLSAAPLGRPVARSDASGRDGHRRAGATP